MDAEFAAKHGCDLASARSGREYVAEQRVALGVVPDDTALTIEYFRDDVESVRVVIHSTFGGRVNAPWGMALARRARDLLSVDVAVQTSDDGIMLRLPALAAAPPIRSLLAQAPAEVERAVLDEVGNTPLFGARFRMNAARALLLPRGRPNRRMPLWLQRLKAVDLLQAVRQYPEFPILVETYREVLRDAFDMDALTGVLREIESGRLPIRIVETERPSPFAAGLQLGFVMEWLYADDTPRAERAAAMLSVDRGMLDDVLGVDDALDEATAAAIDEVLAIRRGTAPGRQARTADEARAPTGARRGSDARRACGSRSARLGRAARAPRVWTRRCPRQRALCPARVSERAPTGDAGAISVACPGSWSGRRCGGAVFVFAAVGGGCATDRMGARGDARGLRRRADAVDLPQGARSRGSPAARWRNSAHRSRRPTSRRSRRSCSDGSMSTRGIAWTKRPASGSSW